MTKTLCTDDLVFLSWTTMSLGYITKLTSRRRFVVVWSILMTVLTSKNYFLVSRQAMKFSFSFVTDDFGPLDDGPNRLQTTIWTIFADEPAILYLTLKFTIIKVSKPPLLHAPSAEVVSALNEASFSSFHLFHWKVCRELWVGYVKQ